MYTRRQIGKLALAGLPFAAAARVTSKIQGVEIGVAAYSYNTLPREGRLDVILRSMTDSQLGDCFSTRPPPNPSISPTTPDHAYGDENPPAPNSPLPWKPFGNGTSKFL